MVEECYECGLVHRFGDQASVVDALQQFCDARLAKLCVCANRRAKLYCASWYTLKGLIAGEFRRRARLKLDDGTTEGWGWRGDILYVDLPGYGQVSFHRMAEWSEWPDKWYRHDWTGIRRITARITRQQIDAAHYKINLRGGLLSRGEAHNQRLYQMTPRDLPRCRNCVGFWASRPMRTLHFTVRNALRLDGWM